MKKNLRLAYLLFVIFSLITAGFVGLVSADIDNDAFNYSKLKDSPNIEKKLPATEYPIWGYKDKNYNFSINHIISPNDSSNRTIVFYWDCLGNNSDYYSFLSSDLVNYTDKSPNKTAWEINQTWYCRHKWDQTGNYSVAVGIFKSNNSERDGPKWEGEYISYWIPVEIRNNTAIEVQNISIMDEKEEFEGNYDDALYNNTRYCGYINSDYSFSVKINATSLGEEDNRTIEETTTVIYWNYNSSKGNDSDNSILGNISYIENITDIKDTTDSAKYVVWSENFTHEWDATGKKNISATTYHWDPLDGSEVYSEHKNTSILIIPDPKNFVQIPFLSNLQDKGLLLSFLGLIILYFTYTRNNVPVKISLFGLKPFYLRSVNSFTATLTFITGMYLYFVFGRCPWDIPIVSDLPRLSNMYFSVLYYEYETHSFYSIPYLSILLGLIDVLTLSLIIHLIAIPLYKGELKFKKPSRIKSSSAPAQSQQGSYSIEEIKHSDN